MILRKPKSSYEHGRSTSLLKLKVLHLLISLFYSSLFFYFCSYSKLIINQVTRGDQEALVTDIIETEEQEQLLLQLYARIISYTSYYITLCYTI